MAREKQDLPDLSNLTEAEIVDMYGDANANAKMAAELSEYLKAALKARFAGRAGQKSGDVYFVTNTLSMQTRLDNEKLKAIVPEELLEQCYKNLEIQTLRVSPVGAKVEEE